MITQSLIHYFKKAESTLLALGSDLKLSNQTAQFVYNQERRTLVDLSKFLLKIKELYQIRSKSFNILKLIDQREEQLKQMKLTVAQLNEMDETELQHKDAAMVMRLKQMSDSLEKKTEEIYLAVQLFNKSNSTVFGPVYIYDDTVRFKFNIRIICKSQGRRRWRSRVWSLLLDKKTWTDN